MVKSLIVKFERQNYTYFQYLQNFRAFFCEKDVVSDLIPEGLPGSHRMKLRNCNQAKLTRQYLPHINKKAISKFILRQPIPPIDDDKECRSASGLHKGCSQDNKP